MHRDDEILVRHIIDSTNKIIEFTSGIDRSRLEEDDMLSLSVVRLLEIIGEAASKVSVEFRSEHMEIPWRKMIGMRNKLIHAYQDVDLDVVWDTVTNDIPPLQEELLRVL